MTLRKIHNNINGFNQQNHRKSHDQQSTIYYDEDQPTHPKKFTHSNKLTQANTKIQQDVGNIINKKDKNNSQKQVSTARQTSRENVKKYQTGKFTALNSSRNSFNQIKAPQKENSQNQNSQQQLFIPQRNKMPMKSPRIVTNNQIRIQQKFRNTTFSIYDRSVSPKTPRSLNGQNNNTAKDTKISQLKLFNPNKTIHQASNLRRFQNQQKQRQKLLNNRIKFISIDNQRQRSKIQLVKRKYQKVLSVRSQFLKQKQTINKKKLSNYLDQMNQKHSKVSLIKQQENQRKLSISRLSHSKTLQASKVRDERKINYREVYRQKMNTLQKKKQIVKSTKSSLQTSRDRINQINKSRIQEIRTIENKKLIKHYLNVDKRQKVNQKLYQTLQKEIKLINQRKLHAASQLKEYEEVLGLKGRKQKQISLISKNNGRVSQQNALGHTNNITQNVKMGRAVSSTFSTSGSKSFYLTNY